MDIAVGSTDINSGTSASFYSYETVTGKRTNENGGEADASEFLL